MKLHGKKGGQFDEERYETIIAKIQNKKSLLQQHLNTLLKRREENGRFLAEELKNLHATKRALQNNITHIQQIKTQLEYKINNELRRRTKILTLTSKSRSSSTTTVHKNRRKKIYAANSRNLSEKKGTAR